LPLIYRDICVKTPISVAVRLLDCWIRGFESRLGPGISYLVLIVWCVGSGLCDELITRVEESYLCV